MASHPSSKLKIFKGNRLFNIDWEHEFFLVKDREKNKFLIYRDTIACNKRRNLDRYSNTKHGEDFTSDVSEARQIKLDQMKKSLTTEQSVFKKVDTSRKSVTAAS
ncbi:EPM2A-interacting protein 1-like [Oopsacas minuta]|uniref:EPM2A-interacting protein 1-like n=1 Tax=Oopsacas minuta TaxID=111878 RepID=A0AAV7KIP0_9METZ|nr:EPM2A-interacting protein 1-like [Oopsacas minuta]